MILKRLNWNQIVYNSKVINRYIYFYIDNKDIKFLSR